MMVVQTLILSVVLAQPAGYKPPEPPSPAKMEAIAERQRELRQRLDDNKAQRLREEWLSQWIVSNGNISSPDVYEQRRKLEALSTKDILNIEKEINRRKKLYASRLAKYNRAQRAQYQVRPYFYWYVTPYGYRWYYGYYRGCY